LYFSVKRILKEPMAAKKKVRKKTRKKKRVPAAVKKKAAKKRAKRKVKKKTEVRFETTPRRGRFRELREFGEAVACEFSIDNQRARRGTIFRVDSRTGEFVRVKSVEPDERVQQDSFEGQKWIAKVGPRTVATYQVTSRLPVWTLLEDAENDFVPPLPIRNNGDLNEATPTAQVYQQAT